MKVIDVSVVAAEDGSYFGWPANHGIWNDGEDVIVGYSKGKHSSQMRFIHTIDRDVPEEYCVIRSKDGGKTWLQPHVLPGYGVEKEECPRYVDFQSSMVKLSYYGHQSWFHVGERDDNQETGMSWEGPFRIPLPFDIYGPPMARTDVLPLSQHSALINLTLRKPSGREGYVACFKTTDGLVSLHQIGTIATAKPNRCYAIMPSTAEMADGTLISIVRREERKKERLWSLTMHTSEDGGYNWFESPLLGPINSVASPASVCASEKVLYTTSYRNKQENTGRIVAAIIGNEPETIWDDFGSQDMGYTQTCLLNDQEALTVFYGNPKGSEHRQITALRHTIE